MPADTNQDLYAALSELLHWGIECTCCGEPARKQCEDHDDGYGVCDRCLEKYGKEAFCSVQSCTAHE